MWFTILLRPKVAREQAVGGMAKSALSARTAVLISIQGTTVNADPQEMNTNVMNLYVKTARPQLVDVALVGGISPHVVVAVVVG